MATIAQLIVDVGANTAKLQTDVQKIQGSFDNVSSMASKVGTAMAGAFTITAITSAASEILNYAGKINDLSAQTGLSTRSIQEMQHAANLTGASLENFTNAAFKLGTNIAGGSNSVQGAIERLGLSYSQLRAMSPEQQFSTIASALGTVQSAQERNKLAVDLFGKAAKEILPAIAQGYDDIASSAIVAGDEQLKALDMAGDALDSFLEGAKNLSVQLAGGLVIAIRAVNDEIVQNLSMVKVLKQSYREWGDVLDTFGVTSVEMPKVLNASAVAARNLPPALAASALSVAELQAAEKKLTDQVNAKIEANKKALKAQEDLQRAHERFASSIQRLDTAEFFVPFKVSVQEASFELEELASKVPPIAENFVHLKDAVQQTSVETQSLTSKMGNFLGGLLTNTSKTMGALQDTVSTKMTAIFGGGGTMHSIISGGLNLVFGPATGIIASLVSQGMEWMASRVWDGLQKIGGFFKSLFGGPSADELAGRDLVTAFERNLSTMLSDAQRLEAGNESWKQTVIAIRDAYVAQGLSEADALAAAERLWQSSKDGAAASQIVIDEIRRIMEGGAAAAGQFASNLDMATRDRTIHIGYSVDAPPDVGGGEWRPEGFATGSGGIRDFGNGTPAILHGRERVQTEAQMEAEQSGGGAAVDELKRLVRQLPQAMKIAVADGLVLAGR